MKAESIFLALVCGLALAAPLGAESSIGVLGGINLATLHEAPADKGAQFSTRSAFEAGAVVDVGLGKRLSLRMEPMYIEKGSNLTFDLFGPVAGTFRFSYVELPVLLSLSFGSGTVRPYVMAGPTVAYLTGAKAHGDTNGKETDVLDMFERTDVGVSFGGGFSAPAGRARVFLEGRYSLGLRNIAKSAQDFDVTLKNRGVAIAAGVTFTLGRR